jgi:predicted SnoaL-like aldol condensation-catalyzing enzyme
MANGLRAYGRLAAEARDQDHIASLNGQEEEGKALSMALEAMVGAFPGSEVIATDTMTDRDHVAIHFAVDAGRTGHEPASAVGILIYRIAEGRIAEHWLQPGVPELSPAPSRTIGAIVSESPPPA